MRRWLMAVALSGVLTTTGCIGGIQPPRGQPSPGPQGAAPARRYGSVVDLKDAAIRAGYACPNWVQSNVVKLAAESGSCAAHDVFSTYVTEADVSTAVQRLKSFGTGVQLLVGPNWVINGRAAHLDLLRQKMGGTAVLEFAPIESLRDVQNRFLQTGLDCNGWTVDEPDLSGHCTGGAFMAFGRVDISAQYNADLEHARKLGRERKGGSSLIVGEDWFVFAPGDQGDLVQKYMGGRREA